MTGKCLLTLCLFVFLASTFAAEQNAAAGRVQNKGLATNPATRPGTVSLPFPTAMPRSITETLPPGTPWRTLELPSLAALRSLVRAAGIIFSGQVIAVQHEAGQVAEISSATIVTFHVEDAFRGAFPGERLKVREWAGLWPRGETYRVGDRVLLFLYRPSRLGFTSPVHSTVGRFEMNPPDTIVLNPWQTEFLSGSREWRNQTHVPYAKFASSIRRAMAAPKITIRSPKDDPGQ